MELPRFRQGARSLGRITGENDNVPLYCTVLHSNDSWWRAPWLVPLLGADMTSSGHDMHDQVSARHRDICSVVPRLSQPKAPSTMEGSNAFAGWTQAEKKGGGG